MSAVEAWRQQRGPHPADPPLDLPPRRAILIGASNLAIHLPTIVETAKSLWGGPLDVLTAHGHGRSYGMTSSVLGRVLPGILACGLWDDLAARAPAPTAALVTDIGNDLLYGVSVETIAAWVEECLHRLAAHTPTLVVTELPLESSLALTAPRFLLLRTAFFPGSRLTLQEALSQSAQLNARVKQIAVRYGAHVIQPSRAWYGFDPIHIRRTRGAQVWRTILGPWSPTSQASIAQYTLAQWIALRRLRPLERRLWGRVQRQAQPAGRLADGTTISMY